MIIFRNYAIKIDRNPLNSTLTLKHAGIEMIRVEEKPPEPPAALLVIT